MGDAATRDGLLRHADRFMNPTWRDGGLYYPRNDQAEDAYGNRTLMEPQTGNALLGYARLNVPDGLWRLYNEKLDRGFLTSPALTRVADDVEVRRAVFDGGALRFTLSLRSDRRGAGTVLLGRMAGRGPWVLRCGGRDIARGQGMSIEASGASTLRVDGEGLELRCPPTGIHDFEMALE
jgi:hypothetical protein